LIINTLLLEEHHQEVMSTICGQRQKLLHSFLR